MGGDGKFCEPGVVYHFFLKNSSVSTSLNSKRMIAVRNVSFQGTFIATDRMFGLTIGLPSPLIAIISYPDVF